MHACGTDIYHLEAGEDNPHVVILIHGGGRSDGRKSFGHNIAPLAEDLHVIVPDLAGFGKTLLPPQSNGTLKYYSNGFIPAFMAAKGVERAFLIGSSLGGGIALGMDPSRVIGIVCVSGFGLYQREFGLAERALLMSPKLNRRALESAHEHKEILKKILRKAEGRGLLSEEAATQVNDYLTGKDNTVELAFMQVLSDELGSSPSAIAADLVRMIVKREGKKVRGFKTNHIERLAELDAAGVPVLLIIGGDDPLFKRSALRKAVSHLENCRLEVIEGSGHSPQIEQPDKFNALVKAFTSEYGMVRSLARP